MSTECSTHSPGIGSRVPLEDLPRGMGPGGFGDLERLSKPTLCCTSVVNTHKDSSFKLLTLPWSVKRSKEGSFSLKRDRKDQSRDFPTAVDLFL